MRYPILKTDLKNILKESGGIFSELNDAHIFITGGTGFIGKWLLESFLYAMNQLQLEMKITVLTRSLHSFQKNFPHLADHSSIDFYEGDVRNFIFPKKKYSHIIHAATPASAILNAKQPEVMKDIIVTGMKHILEFADYCDTKNLLFISSGAVYGKSKTNLNRMDENELLNPDVNSAYAQGKFLAEKMCFENLNHTLNIKIARCFAFVGPYLPLDIHYAIGNFIHDVINNKPVQVKNPAPVFRSYQYAADMVIWLLNIFLKGQNNRPYNVGSDEIISIIDLAKLVAKLAGKENQIGLPNIDQNGIPDFYVPSVERAKNELGLRNIYSLNQAILQTIEWNKNN